MKEPESPFDRLSPRHRECLRLTSALKTTKEIAAELGLSPGTVSNYCAEAIEIIGARDRRDAARRFAAYEADPFNVHVRKVGGDHGSVSDDAERGPSAIDWRALLPVRRKGSVHNDLHPAARLLWIFLLAAFFIGIFGLFVGALDTVTDIYARLGHHAG